MSLLTRGLSRVSRLHLASLLVLVQGCATGSDAQASAESGTTDTLHPATGPAPVSVLPTPQGIERAPGPPPEPPAVIAPGAVSPAMPVVAPSPEPMPVQTAVPAVIAEPAEAEVPPAGAAMTANSGEPSTPIVPIAPPMNGEPQLPAPESPDPVVLGSVTISAGEVDRSNGILTFQVPKELSQVLKDGAMAVDGSGVQLPVQVDTDGTATLVVQALGSNQELTLSLVSAPSTAAIRAVTEEDGVHFRLGDKTAFRFVTQAQVPEGLAKHFGRGGYVHPILTPAGARVTGDYAPDHPHHHGLWSAWRDVEFDGRETDFWNTDHDDGLGDFRTLDTSWSGAVHAGLRAKLVQIDLTGGEPIDALNEEWEIRAYRTHPSDAPYFVFDIISSQTPASDIPLRLGEYLYGGFGIRGREDWLPDNSDFLTSEGRTRADGENTGARWVYFGGNVAGDQAGMAILGHPDNFRAPQKVRLHPEMPYFSYAPVKDGGFTIEPDESYVTKFRVVTFDGQPDAALIEQLWLDYAEPATATFSQ